MSLSEFHNSVAVNQDDTSSGTQVRMNWADEMDKVQGDDTPSEWFITIQDMTLSLCLYKHILIFYLDPTFVFDRSVLPTAPKSILKPDIDLEQVPKVKPFRAFIANVSFEADEEKVNSK